MVQHQSHVIYVKTKSPGVAAILSFFYTGLGQIYNGQVGKGIIFAIIQAINIGLMFLVIGFITYPIFWIWGMLDAYKIANKADEIPAQLPGKTIATASPGSIDKLDLKDETMECPACAEVIKLKAKKCRFCGADFDPQEVDRRVEERRVRVEAARREQKGAMGLTQCPACGGWEVHRAYIEDGSLGDWCPHCKKSLRKMRGEI